MGVPFYGAASADTRGRVFALNHLLFHIQFYKRVLQEDRVVGDFGVTNLRPLTLTLAWGT